MMDHNDLKGFRIPASATRVGVKVYAEDRKTVLAEVSPQATSIGASKAAGVRSCQLSRVNGRLSWVVKERS